LTEERDPKAEERMRVILEHWAGRKNATEAATDLRVSRKTFYEWLDRAKDGIYQAVKDRHGGRPPEPVDTEKEELRQEVETLEKERAVLEGRLRIQQAIRQTVEELRAPLGKKKEAGTDGPGR